VKARNFAGAIAVAVILSLPFIVPRVAGIDTWKIVLGLAGLAIFISAGLTKSA